jgi:alpha-glucosidase
VVEASSPWWADRTGYEIYVPSFADSDGDGWGDLPGVVSRLDYLADLGVDLLWLSPIHPSPFADHGYDVADYLDVDPRFGTLADVDRLLADSDRRGMKVLLDLVPNHTSDEHRWFRRSRSSRDNPYRGYYHWRDPAPDGGPPNNWASAFGGPAWTFDEATGQFYLHLFSARQPDLNWDDGRVADEFDAILRFWLDRGAAGFRIDVANALVKAPGLPDQPVRRPGEPHRGGSAASRDWLRLDHIYDHDQPGVLAIHRRWRQVVAPYDALLLGEVYLVDPQGLAPYVRGQDGLHLLFWFGLVESGWEPDRFEELVRGAAVAVPHLAWVQSSHDSSRAVTRYGGGEAGRRRALTLATLTIGLPVLPVLYQGEELGLDDAELRPDEVQDPLAVSGGYSRSRDVARTPLPWAPGPGFGFTTADTAWLPFGDRRPQDTVAVQRDDPRSPLAAYRALLTTRRRLPGLRRGEPCWIGREAPVLAYVRGDCLVAANVGGRAETLPVPSGRWRVEFATDGGPARPVEGQLRLAAEQATILSR